MNDHICRCDLCKARENLPKGYQHVAEFQDPALPQELDELPSKEKIFATDSLQPKEDLMPGKKGVTGAEALRKKLGMTASPTLRFFTTILMGLR